MLSTDSTSTRLWKKFVGPLGTRVRAILALGIVLGLGAVGTLALWSNSAVTTSGDFRTGVVDLQVKGVKDYVFSATTTPFTMTNMLPGESRAATLQVQNTLSTIPVTYTMAARTSAGSPTLANYLRMTVSGSASPTNTTSGGLATGSCGGTQIGSATLSSTSSVPVITAPRPLAAATATDSVQDLCIVVSLAANTPLSEQSRIVSAIILTFSATTS